MPDSAEAVLRALRCEPCQGRGEALNVNTPGDTRDCPACAGTGMSPDVTWADIGADIYPALVPPATGYGDDDRDRDPDVVALLDCLKATATPGGRVPRVADEVEVLATEVASRIGDCPELVKALKTLVKARDELVAAYYAP